MGRLCSFREGWSSSLAAGLTLGPSASSEARTCLFSLFLRLAELLGREAQRRLRAAPVTCYPRWEEGSRQGVLKGSCSRRDFPVSLWAATELASASVVS